jgi:psp operon transcriptional activator
MAAENGREHWPGFAEHVSRQLEDHQWPGNVRELRNVIERAVYRWDNWEEPIGHVQFDPFDSPWKPVGERRPAAPESAPKASETVQRTPEYDSIEDLRAAVEAHERAIVEHHLGRNRWNQRQTAKALGLTYDQLRHCIRKHGLTDAE